jgi:hypothetical protein
MNICNDFLRLNALLLLSAPIVCYIHRQLHIVGHMLIDETFDLDNLRDLFACKP